MKICFLANGCIHTQRWINYFSKKADVHLITFFPSNIPNITTHYLGLYSKYNFLLNLIKIRKTLRKIKPDVIHTHGAGGYSFYLALTKYPFIVSVWGSDVASEPYKNILRLLLTKLAISKAKVIHVSDVFAEEKVLALGGKKNKIVTLPWGVDIGMFSKNKKSAKWTKKIGGAGKRTVLIVFNGDAEPRAAVIANAINSLADKKINFIIVNSQNIKNYSVAAQIIDRLSHTEMSYYLANSDIFIDPYSPNNPLEGGHGHGLTMLEAMASSTNTLAAARPEVTLSDENQWYFGHIYVGTSSEDLANKITHILNVNVSASRKKNLFSIKKDFDWGKNMHKIFKIYQKIKQLHKV